MRREKKKKGHNKEYSFSNYLDQATVSISAWAPLYSSNLLAREIRRCIIAGSSSNNLPNCFACKYMMYSKQLGISHHVLLARWVKDKLKNLPPFFPIQRRNGQVSHAWPHVLDNKQQTLGWSSSNFQAPYGHMTTRWNLSLKDEYIIKQSILH